MRPFEHCFQRVIARHNQFGIRRIEVNDVAIRILGLPVGSRRPERTPARDSFSLLATTRAASISGGSIDHHIGDAAAAVSALVPPTSALAVRDTANDHYGRATGHGAESRGGEIRADAHPLPVFNPVSTVVVVVIPVLPTVLVTVLPVVLTVRTIAHAIAAAKAPERGGG